jgi:ArsR family transcriptional regulator, virulence genes transcriptional regulator
MELPMKTCSISFNRNVDQAAKLLSTMGNARRLQIICILLNSEIAVGALAERIGLSQSALSQHLAKLRKLNLVTARRDAQHLYYSLNSEAAVKVLETLEGIYGDTTGPARRS